MVDDVCRRDETFSLYENTSGLAEVMSHFRARNWTILGGWRRFMLVFLCRSQI
jgi:hypothetical protein